MTSSWPVLRKTAELKCVTGVDKQVNDVQINFDKNAARQILDNAEGTMPFNKVALEVLSPIEDQAEAQ